MIKSLQIPAIALLVALLTLSFCATVVAQQTTGEIRGTVTDATRGEALIGANIVVVGTSYGAAANTEGVYSINKIPPGRYTLSVRFVGYKAQTKEVSVDVGRAATVDFALEATPVQMDEVVVTGQGFAIEKRKLASSVETISGKDIQLAPVQSIDQLLQGRIPGLQSFMPGGAPGTGARIITRGVKSALNSTTPVIYVDGVRVDNNPEGRLAPGTGGQRSSSLADIVTGEIDHVEVIKGGAAATLYGSEAANGVIQIFTKKGVPGAGRWTANVTSGFDAPTLRNVWSDYTKNHYFQNGPFQSYRIGADGGTESMTYNISAKMSESKGVSVRNQLGEKLYNISAGLRALTGEKSNVEFSTSFTNTSFGKQFNDNAIAAPFATLEIEGSIEPQRTSNPDSVLNAYLLPDLHEVVNRWIASTNFNYNPYGWWQNRFTLGVDYRKSEARSFSSIEAGPVISTPGGQLIRADREYVTLTVNYNATFTLPDVGPIAQRVTAGAQAFHVGDREISGTGTNFKIPGTQIFSNASTITAAENNQELFSYGFILQDQVGVWNRLFLDLGVRFDGNTAFGSDIPIQIYPKVGAAYNISEESFYPEDFKSYLSSLKIRASVGQTGNFPPPFTRDRSYTSTAYGTEAALNFGNPGNTELGPDKTTSYDVGFDMGLFNDRVSVEFSYYKQITKDAQFNVTADVASGFQTNRRVNIGEIQNKGVELTVRANILSYENLELNLRASGATNDNVVTSMGGAAEFTVAGFTYAPMQVKQGYAIGTIMAFSPRIESDGTFKANTDSKYIGGPTPTKTASVGIDLVLFKDLSISALAEGAFGHYVLNQGEARRLVNALSALTSNTPGTGNGLYSSIFTQLNWPVNAANGQYIPRNNASAYLIERGDFIKLREVSVRYRVPREFFGGVYLTASVRNPLTIMQKARHADPESSFIPVRGVELGGVVGATVEAPIQWRFGIDVTL
jgi:TonB-dependent starch-binding outer membrane protein SusC